MWEADSEYWSHWVEAEDYNIQQPFERAQDLASRVLLIDEVETRAYWGEAELYTESSLHVTLLEGSFKTQIFLHTPGHMDINLIVLRS